MFATITYSIQTSRKQAKLCVFGYYGGRKETTFVGILIEQTLQIPNCSQRTLGPTNSSVSIPVSTEC